MRQARILLISLPVNIFVVPLAEYAGVPVIEGLIQRVEIFLFWTWLALTALRLWRQELQARSGEVSTRSAVTTVNAD